MSFGKIVSQSPRFASDCPNMLEDNFKIQGGYDKTETDNFSNDAKFNLDKKMKVNTRREFSPFTPEDSFGYQLKERESRANLASIVQTSRPSDLEIDSGIDAEKPVHLPTLAPVRTPRRTFPLKTIFFDGKNRQRDVAKVDHVKIDAESDKSMSDTVKNENSDDDNSMPVIKEELNCAIDDVDRKGTLNDTGAINSTNEQGRDHVDQTSCNGISETSINFENVESAQAAKNCEASFISKSDDFDEYNTISKVPSAEQNTEETVSEEFLQSLHAEVASRMKELAALKAKNDDVKVSSALKKSLIHTLNCRLEEVTQEVEIVNNELQMRHKCLERQCMDKLDNEDSIRLSHEALKNIREEIKSLDRSLEIAEKKRRSLAMKAKKLKINTINTLSNPQSPIDRTTSLNDQSTVNNVKDSAQKEGFKSESPENSSQKSCYSSAWEMTSSDGSEDEDDAMTNNPSVRSSFQSISFPCKQPVSIFEDNTAKMLEKGGLCLRSYNSDDIVHKLYRSKISDENDADVDVKAGISHLELSSTAAEFAKSNDKDKDVNISGDRN